jgi:hypothetical protein
MNKPGQDASPPSVSLEALCNEAVAAHGANWPAIEAYVAGRLEAMDEADRAALMRDVREMLTNGARDAPSS